MHKLLKCAFQFKEERQFRSTDKLTGTLYAKTFLPCTFSAGWAGDPVGQHDHGCRPSSTVRRTAADTGAQHVCTCAATIFVHVYSIASNNNCKDFNRQSRSRIHNLLLLPSQYSQTTMYCTHTFVTSRLYTFILCTVEWPARWRI